MLWFCCRRRFRILSYKLHSGARFPYIPICDFAARRSTSCGFAGSSATAQKSDKRHSGKVAALIAARVGTFLHTQNRVFKPLKSKALDLCKRVVQNSGHENRLCPHLDGRSKRPEVTKRSDLTHKRTNHELRRPCERYRARP